MKVAQRFMKPTALQSCPKVPAVQNPFGALDRARWETSQELRDSRVRCSALAIRSGFLYGSACSVGDVQWAAMAQAVEKGFGV